MNEVKQGYTSVLAPAYSWGSLTYHRAYMNYWRGRVAIWKARLEAKPSRNRQAAYDNAMMQLELHASVVRGLLYR